MSPNESILRDDELRLRSLRRGEDVFGSEWQLCYVVWNFAPAAQLVGVEQLQPDDSWLVIQKCHTIEFQTRAAVRRSFIIREHAASVEWNASEAQSPRLRFFLQGVGQVKLGKIELRNGRKAYSLKGSAQWRMLGNPAPSRGLPDMTSRVTLDLNFDV